MSELIRSPMEADTTEADQILDLLANNENTNQGYMDTDDLAFDQPAVSPVEHDASRTATDARESPPTDAHDEDTREAHIVPKRKFFPTRSKPKAASGDVSREDSQAFGASIGVLSGAYSGNTNSNAITMSASITHATGLQLSNHTSVPFDRSVTYLDVSGLGLDSLDPLCLEIAFPALITLVAANNNLTALPCDSFFDRRSTSAAQLWNLDFSNNRLQFAGDEAPMKYQQRPLALVCPVLGTLNLSGNQQLSLEGVRKALAGLIVADLYLPEHIAGSGNVASEITKFLTLERRGAHGTTIGSTPMRSTSPVATRQSQALSSILDVIGGCLAVNGYCLPLAPALQAKRYELVQQTLRTAANQWRPQRDLLRVLHRRNVGDTTSPLDESRELLTCFICANENLRVTARVKAQCQQQQQQTPHPWEIPCPHSTSTGPYAYNIQRSFWHQAPVQWSHWKMIDESSNAQERFSYVFVHTVAAAAECEYLDRETLAIITARLIDEELTRQQRNHEAALEAHRMGNSTTGSLSSQPPTPNSSFLIGIDGGSSNTLGGRKKSSGTVNAAAGSRKGSHKSLSLLQHGESSAASRQPIGERRFSKEDEEVIAQLAGDVLSWPMYVLQYIAHRLCAHRQMAYPFQPTAVDVMAVHKHVQLALTDDTFADLVKVSAEFERRVKHYKAHGGTAANGGGGGGVGRQRVLANPSASLKNVAGDSPSASGNSAAARGYRAKLFSRLNGSHSLRDTLHFVTEETAERQQPMYHTNSFRAPPRPHYAPAAQWSDDQATDEMLGLADPSVLYHPSTLSHPTMIFARNASVTDIVPMSSKTASPVRGSPLASPAKGGRWAGGDTTFLTTVSGIEGSTGLHGAGEDEARVSGGSQASSPSPMRGGADPSKQQQREEAPMLVDEDEPLLGSDAICTKGLLGAEPFQMERMRQRDLRSRMISDQSRAQRADRDYKNAVMRQPPLRVPRPSSCLAIQQALQDEQQSRMERRGEVHPAHAEDASAVYHNHNTVNIRVRSALGGGEVSNISRPGTPSASAGGGPRAQSVPILIDASVAPSSDPMAGLTAREREIASMTLEEFMASRGVKRVCGDQKLIASVLTWGDEGEDGPEELRVEERLREIFDKSGASQWREADANNASTSSDPSLEAPVSWPIPNYKLARATLASADPRQRASATLASAMMKKNSASNTSHLQKAVVSQFSDARATRKLLSDTTPHLTANTRDPSQWEGVSNAIRLVDTTATMHPFTAKAAETMNRLRERSELKRRVRDIDASQAGATNTSTGGSGIGIGVRAGADASVMLMASGGGGGRESVADHKARATACSSSLRTIRVSHRGPDTHQFIPVEIRKELERRKRGGSSTPTFR